MIVCIIVKKEGFHSDSGLVAACVKKDPAAWDYFVKKYSRLISVSIQVRIAKYAVTLPCQEIEDIKQAVLMSIWQKEKLRQIKDLRGISYWLSIVSGNEAFEYLRKKHGAKSPEMVPIYDKLGGPIDDIAASENSSPSCELDSKEIVKKIEDAVELLRGKEKLIAKMNILFGKKYHEIAECLRIPEGTVSSYAKRAKDKLRRRLKDVL